MTAAQPTIIATSISVPRADEGTQERDSGPAFLYAAQLARAGNHPKLCVIATAVGDDPGHLVACYSAFSQLEMLVSHVGLFPMPNIANMRDHLMNQDIIWVAGGSTANLLAVWRLHGIDEILRECWQSGVVLMGTSAGSVCWHAAGTTDSFRLPLQPITNGLGFLPYSNSPHYSSEPERRPLTNRLVADGVIPNAFASDDGAGLVYFGTDVHEAISVTQGAKCYSITRTGEGKAAEAELATRLL